MSKIIAGNWKMNKTNAQAREFFKTFPKVGGAKVVICPPFTSLATARECAHPDVVIGAQNIHFNPSGAHTGAISAEMLAELGVGAVLIGHSERREEGGDTNTRVQRKVKTALENNFLTILCVGEKEKSRENGTYKEDLKKQLKLALVGLTASDIDNLVVAYEPIWAIGTGKVATLDQIRETHATLKRVLNKLFDSDVPLLYGGSVNETNSREILSIPNVDGVLVGGAALDPAKFAKIANSIID